MAPRHGPRAPLNAGLLYKHEMLQRETRAAGWTGFAGRRRWLSGKFRRGWRTRPRGRARAGAKQGLLGKAGGAVRRTLARPRPRTRSSVLFCLIRKLVFTHLISAFQFYFTFAVGSVSLNGSCFTAHGTATDLAPDAAPRASPRARGRAEENGHRARPAVLWQRRVSGGDALPRADGVSKGDRSRPTLGTGRPQPSAVLKGLDLSLHSAPLPEGKRKPFISLLIL